MHLLRELRRSPVGISRHLRRLPACREVCLCVDIVGWDCPGRWGSRPNNQLEVSSVVGGFFGGSSAPDVPPRAVIPTPPLGDGDRVEHATEPLPFEKPAVSTRSRRGESVMTAGVTAVVGPTGRPTPVF